MRDYEFYYTQDGSVGLYSYADDDVYHSKFGALTEAWEKFILPAEIDKKLNTKPEIRVLDVCYGIGYNTKALMTHVINSDKKYLKKNILKKFFRKILKFLQKKIKILSTPIETINDDNNFCLSRVKIDCLDINDELVKISPLLKTVITPQEIFTKIVPKVFDCFDTYWKLKKYFARKGPKNSKNITEILELKFDNNYLEINNNFKVHKFVNYIIADALLEYYKEDYLTKNQLENISSKSKKKFFDKRMLNYTKFMQNYRYNLLAQWNLLAFLHNIYYDHLSKRDKKIKFKDIERLFELSFYVNDARKTILDIKGEYDYIFLDAFTYSKAPELWSVEFIAELYKHLSDDGIIMTYSNSALVRNTLLENGFCVGKIFDEKNGKFIGTVAAKDKSLIKCPLSNYEIGLCKTKAGIPYHDPGLNLDKKEILSHRENEFKTSELISSSVYIKNRKAKRENNDE